MRKNIVQRRIMRGRGGTMEWRLKLRNKINKRSAQRRVYRKEEDCQIERRRRGQTERRTE
jgi:hypothetical protein